MSGGHEARLHAVAAALITASVTSWWAFGTAPSDHIEIVIVVAVAAFKVGAILRWFMDVGTAPRFVRTFFSAWIGISSTAIVGLHWLFPG